MGKEIKKNSIFSICLQLNIYFKVIASASLLASKYQIVPQ